MNENIAEVTRPYLAARGNMQYRAIDALRFVRDPDIASNMQQFTCRHERLMKSPTAPTVLTAAWTEMLNTNQRRIKIKCLITGCELLDRSHNRIVHGDLHEEGDCFVFNACYTKENGTAWSYDIGDKLETHAVVSIPFGYEYRDFRSVIVIPKNIADLNKAARDYIGL